MGKSRRTDDEQSHGALDNTWVAASRLSVQSLQATVGNKAVSALFRDRTGRGILAQSTAPGEPNPPAARPQKLPIQPDWVPLASPLQRYIGIEAELTVPVTGGLPAGNPDQIIRNFLGTGAAYKTPLAAAAGGFAKTTDHDRMGKVGIETARKKMDQKLIGAAKAGIAKPADHAGNIEYVTDKGGAPAAYDEFNSADLKAFRKSIKAMAQDMNATVAAAKTGVTQVGGNQYGLPPVADWQGFAAASGGAVTHGFATGAHTDLHQYISDHLYVQITAGITPRSIAKYLRRLGTNPRLASLREQYGGVNAAERQMVSFLTEGAVTAASAALALTAAALNWGHDLRNSKSLHGFVSLVMSYIFGMYYTVQRWVAGGQAGAILGKNAVAALVKLPLNEVLHELDQAKRPDLWAAGDRNQLAADIVTIANARLNAAPINAAAPVTGPGGAVLYASSHAGVTAAFGGTLGGTWNAAWLPQVLNGNAGADPFYTGFVAPSVIHPLDHPRGKAITTGAGRAARNVGGQETGGGIPLEMRFIQEHPTPNQLLDLVNAAIKHVRKAHGAFS